MKINFKDWRVWAIFVGIIMAIVAVVFGFVLLFSPTPQLSTPKNLRVYSNGTRTFVDVEEVNNASSYQFLITDKNQESIYVPSNTYSAEITDYLRTGGVYTIMCKAIGEGKIANSEYCDKFYFINNIQLQKPTITLTQPKEITVTLQQTFNETVDISFVLNYSVLNNGTFLTMTQISSVSGGQFTATFNLSSLNIGEYNISVQAVSSNEFYLKSTISNILPINITN